MRRGASLSGLSLLDIAPLLLYTLGLPIPAEMEGQVSKAIFAPGHFESHPVVVQQDASGSLTHESALPEVDPRIGAEVMSHLRALGYME